MDGRFGKPDMETRRMLSNKAATQRDQIEPFFKNGLMRTKASKDKVVRADFADMGGGQNTEGFESQNKVH